MCFLKVVWEEERRRSRKTRRDTLEAPHALTRKESKLSQTAASHMFGGGGYSYSDLAAAVGDSRDGVEGGGGGGGGGG